MSLTWQQVAGVLAERVSHLAYCDRHPESKADPENCPACADRAAYRAWEVKSGRTHREPPYTGGVLDVFEHERTTRGEAP